MTHRSSLTLVSPTFQVCTSQKWVLERDRELKFELGEQRLSGKGHPRTIIGYAFDPKRKLALYIIRMQDVGAGAIDAKRVFLANAQYGPVQGLDQQVLKSLLPKPGKH